MARRPCSGARAVCAGLLFLCAAWTAPTLAADPCASWLDPSKAAPIPRRIIFAAPGETVSLGWSAGLLPSRVRLTDLREPSVQLDAQLKSAAGGLSLAIPADTPPDLFCMGAAPGASPLLSATSAPVLIRVRRTGQANLRVVQLTDLHFADEPDDPGKKERLIAAVESINRLDPDLVICTGDLLTSPGPDAGRRKQAEELQGILRRLTVPIFYVPGNHDYRDGLKTFRKYFTRSTYASFDVGSYHFIGVDTGQLVSLKHFWELHEMVGPDTAQMAWLERDLKSAAGRNVVFFMHGSPTLSGSTFEQNLARFKELALAAGVKAVLVGHVHEDMIQDLRSGREMTAFAADSIPVMHTTTIGSTRLRGGKYYGFRLIVLGPAGVDSTTPLRSLPPGAVARRCEQGVDLADRCCLLNETQSPPLPLPVRLDVRAGTPASVPPPARLLWEGKNGEATLRSYALDLAPGSCSWVAGEIR